MKITKEFHLALQDGCVLSLLDMGGGQCKLTLQTNEQESPTKVSCLLTRECFEELINLKYEIAWGEDEH